jgi:hypothetical protein
MPPMPFSKTALMEARPSLMKVFFVFGETSCARTVATSDVTSASASAVCSACNWDRLASNSSRNLRVLLGPLDLLDARVDDAGGPRRHLARHASSKLDQPFLLKEVIRPI